MPGWFLSLSTLGSVARRGYSPCLVGSLMFPPGMFGALDDSGDHPSNVFGSFFVPLFGVVFCLQLEFPDLCVVVSGGFVAASMFIANVSLAVA